MVTTSRPDYQSPEYFQSFSDLKEEEQDTKFPSWITVLWVQLHNVTEHNVHGTEVSII